jgi:hypothetical protein
MAVAKVAKTFEIAAPPIEFLRSALTCPQSGESAAAAIVFEQATRFLPLPQKNPKKSPFASRGFFSNALSTEEGIFHHVATCRFTSRASTGMIRSPTMKGAATWLTSQR